MILAMQNNQIKKQKGSTFKINYERDRKKFFKYRNKIKISGCGTVDILVHPSI